MNPEAFFPQLMAIPAAHRHGCALLRAKRAPLPALRQASDAARAAKVPTLVITGGWSRSIDEIGRSAARLTGGTMQVVPAPNPYVQQENPRAFNEALSALLPDLSAGR